MNSRSLLTCQYLIAHPFHWLWCSIFAFLLCFPLACLPSFSFLKYSSFAGLVVVIYVIILVAVFFLFPVLTGMLWATHSCRVRFFVLFDPSAIGFGRMAP
jgi:amino acid permease